MIQIIISLSLKWVNATRDYLHIYVLVITRKIKEIDFSLFTIYSNDETHIHTRK